MSLIISIIIVTFLNTYEVIIIMEAKAPYQYEVIIILEVKAPYQYEVIIIMEVKAPYQYEVIIIMEVKSPYQYEVHQSKSGASNWLFPHMRQQ